MGRGESDPYRRHDIHLKPPRGAPLIPRTPPPFSIMPRSPTLSTQAA